MNVDKLKKCPMCGSETTTAFMDVFDSESPDATRFRTMCRSCGLMTAQYRTGAEALAAWNRRADETDALKAALKDMWFAYVNKDADVPHAFEIEAVNQATQILGYWNTGDKNTGCWNTGNKNTGDKNTGNWNTGNWNNTDYSAGFFCTERQTVKMFDIETDKTRDKLMEELPSILWLIPFGNYWENGELKTYAAQDRQKFYDSLSDAEKQEIKSMQFFNAEKFEKCTGIKVEG